jgi:hypothetical protein
MNSEQLKNYLYKELREIGKPNNLAQTYKFQNLEDIVEVLFTVLDVKIDEPTLQRTGENFFNHVEKIVKFKENELPIAIEGLATNFEPFLKLIAFLKYEGTEYWHGDNQYCEGIIKTTLNNLITGKINNKHNSPKDIPLINLPEKLINYSGTQQSIIDFVRQNLRNAVHNANEYRRHELFYYSNLVISCYLFAINHNILFLKTKFFDSYKYLKSIVGDANNLNLDNIYVDLIGKEKHPELDIKAIDYVDEIELLNVVNRFENNENIDDRLITEENNAQSILSIAEKYLHFEIIGDAGSGKTTTLKKIQINRAIKILKGDYRLKIPFFINAHEFQKSNTFLKMILDNESNIWVKKEFINGNILILIDGLNEIPYQHSNEAYFEIEKIIREYPNNGIILSERKYGFEKKIDIKIFEIKPLNNNQIKIFLNNYSLKNSNNLWAKIAENESMLQLAYNPLLLKMLLSVSKNGEIPNNKGLLFDLFIKTIFQRELKKQIQINPEIKTDLLSNIAHEMRLNGFISVSKNTFKDLILKYVKELNSSINYITLFQELLNNQIIKISSSEDVSFFHESYQEYFCSIKLKNEFELTNAITINYTDKTWYDSLLMCSELIKNKERSIMFFDYLFKDTKPNLKSKYLDNIDNSDLNKNIIISCKIAWELRSIKPDIYVTAENYLSNYLVIWKHLYFKNKLAEFPIEDLFAAVVALNSYKNIRSIILEDSWAYIWLFFENTDEKKLKIKQLNLIIEKIKNNTPDFTYFYDLLNVAIQKYYAFTSIVYCIENLKKSLLANLPENQLIKYYNNNKNFDVLLVLIKTDVAFIKDYQFYPENNLKNLDIIKILVKYHHQYEDIRDIILKELKTSAYNAKQLKPILELMLSNKYLNFVLEYLEFILEYDDKLFSELVNIIQLIPFIKLTERLKRVFNCQYTEKDVHDLNFSTLNINDHHPDIIKSDIKFIEKIKQSIKNVACIDFVKNLGISYLFHESLKEIKYGIVTNIRDSSNTVLIIEIESQKQPEYRLIIDDITKFSVEDIVVIELNRTINTINVSNSSLQKIGFVDSEILSINSSKNEGFIRRLNDTVSKDYFFNFKSCDYLPEKGDKVVFIPAINTHKKYLNEPIALRISKIKMSKCHVKRITHNQIKNIISGEAEDLESKEKLFFMIRGIDNENCTPSIEENKIYEYSTIKEPVNDRLKRIKLKL